MKLLNKFLISVAAVSLVACSSMDIDEAEAIAGNFPEDFDKTEYLNLHPQLVGLQVRDYVASYNTTVSETLTKEDITADEEAFVDTAILHVIYVTPTLGGLSEELWQEAFAPVEKKEVSCLTEKKFTVLNYQVISAEGDTGSVEKLYDPITVKYDENDTSKTAIISASGKSDTTEDAVVKEIVVSDSLFIPSGAKRGTTVLDTISCDTTSTPVPGSLSTSQLSYLKKFNFVDTRDDLTRLMAFAIDTMAVAYQYVMFGKGQGWAYRKCKPTEVNNEVITEEYPVTKLYCADDDGNVREIK